MRLATPVTGLGSVLLILMFVSPRLNGFHGWPTLQAIAGWPPVRGGVRPFPPLIMLWTLFGWIFVHIAGMALAWVNGRWLARFGLPEHDRRAILRAPLARPSLWKREEIAAVLRPAPADEPAPARTPAEMVHRIASAAAAFSGRDAGVAQEAAAAARQLLASILEADEEVERLSRDLDPQEHERVRARLAGLGVEVASEPEERRRMRALFAQQLSLLGELEARLGRASDRRQRRVELLKSLWLEIANLKAAATVAVEGETSARVQALCARIAASHTASTQALGEPDDDRPTLAR
jgi:hypothetical protein